MCVPPGWEASHYPLASSVDDEPSNSSAEERQGRVAGERNTYERMSGPIAGHSPTPLSTSACGLLKVPLS